jgi:hypothetical protein
MVLTNVKDENRNEKYSQTLFHWYPSPISPLYESTISRKNRVPKENVDDELLLVQGPLHRAEVAVYHQISMCLITIRRHLCSRIVSLGVVMFADDSS